MIGGNMESILLTTIYKDKMVEYWSQTFSISRQRQPSCDWEMYFRSVRTQLPRERPTILKYNAHILPVRKNLKRRHHSEDDICPCCGSTEDHDHIIQCIHPTMEQAFQAQLEGVHTFMLQDCPDNFRAAILQLLITFRSGTHIEQFDTDLSSLAKEQLDYGMRPFFAGLWLKQWRLIHAEFLQQISPRKSSELWMVRLLHKIQKIPINMWKTRNHLLYHSNNDNEKLKTHHKELDDIIERIYERKPHSRAMAHCDVAFFRKYNKDMVKKFKVQRKNNWVTSANLILTKYGRVGSTTQSKQFMSFFQWDRG
mmetsp:Transcript_14149/g.26560  ORF Transcript_14149/g.26560 Transcript_14149/m.26560 type:complete len:310 (+) Transcript_14149:5669-6598(+)